MTDGMQYESVHDIESSLFTLLESRRKIQELIQADKENEELRAVEVDIEIAIEDMRKRMISRRALKSNSWASGDICEVLWSNDVWYQAIVVKKSPNRDNEWYVKLLGYGHTAIASSQRMRALQSDKWYVGQTCLALEGVSSLEDLRKIYIADDSGSENNLGQYAKATVDSLSAENEFAWLTFLRPSGHEKMLLANAGKSIKLPVAFLAKAGQEKPMKGSLESSKTSAVDKKNTKMAKRDQFLQRKENLKKRSAETLSSWKKHFRKG